MVGLAMNSDMLLPYSYAWDISQHADGWRMHELARIPSFVPDLATLGALLVITGSDRWTIVLYGMTQSLAFIHIGALLCRKLSGASFTTGAAAMFLLFSVLVALEMATGGARVVLDAFLPVDHFGPFLLSLLGGWIGVEQVARPRARNLWWLAAIASFDYLGDQLLLVEFVVPLAGACLLLDRAGKLPRAQTLRMAGAVAAGLLAGRLAYAALLHAGMRFETPLSLWPRMMARAAGYFARSLPGFAAQHPAALALGFGVPLVAYAHYPMLLVRSAKTDKDLAWQRAFLWCYAGLAIVGATVFTACFYENEANHRYLIAVWAWLLIFAAATILRLPSPLRWLRGSTLACVLAFVAVFIGVDEGSIGVLTWDSDTAACVRRLKEPLSLHAGLADYWDSRSVMMATHWSVQVDQIYANGGAYLWGNDPDWYRRDRVDPARPPDYDFIIMRRLDQARIRAVYGEPARIEPCGDTTIWIYREAGGLYPKLLAVSPDLKISSANEESVGE
jgi:hypothetical protein